MILDTGASINLVSDLSFLRDSIMLEKPLFVCTANGTNVPVDGYGVLKLSTDDSIVEI